MRELVGAAGYLARPGLKVASAVANDVTNLGHTGIGFTTNAAMKSAQLAHRATTTTIGATNYLLGTTADVASKAASVALGTANWAAQGTKYVGNGVTGVAMNIANQAWNGVGNGIQAIGNGLTSMLSGGSQLTSNLLGSPKKHQPSHQPYDHVDIELKDVRKQPDEWEDIGSYFIHGGRIVDGSQFGNKNRGLAAKKPIRRRGTP